VARFRDAVRPGQHPEDWFAANVDAPLLIIAPYLFGLAATTYAPGFKSSI
jgi:hypothetical protein